MILDTIFKDTKEVITSSIKSGDNSPFAYHNWALGWSRFDGKKNEGSFIKELTDFNSTWDMLVSAPWEKMSDSEVSKECDVDIHSIYLKADIPEGMTGYMGGCPLDKLPSFLVPDVRVSAHRHGYSLYCDVEEAYFRRVHTMRLIISKSSNPHNPHGKDIVATWFPGTLANPNALTTLDKSFVKFTLSTTIQ